jgi:hypothetical protein
MKSKFTFIAIALLAGFTLTSCVRDQLPDNNENYWLSQERGEVVYSDSYCNYYVVETYNGYTIVRAWGNYKPYEGAMVYGNFSNGGPRDFYNRSSGVIFSGTVTDYWLDYYEAQDALDYYCPLGAKGIKREFKKSTIRSETKK